MMAQVLMRGKQHWMMLRGSQVWNAEYLIIANNQMRSETSGVLRNGFYSIEMTEMYLLCSREILIAFQRQLVGEIKNTNWKILLH